MKPLVALAAPLLSSFVFSVPVLAADADTATPREANAEQSVRKIPRHSHGPDKSGVAGSAPAQPDPGKTRPAQDMNKHHHPRDR